MDELDTTLYGLQSALRRRVSSLEPPIGMPGDPWLVPVGAFRAAQAEQVRRQSASMAVRHDSLDLSYNYSMQGAYETALGQRDMRDVPASLRMQVERMIFDGTHRAADGAIAGLDNEALRANGGIALPGASLAPPPEYTRPPRLPHPETVGALEYAGKALGTVFDGKRFIKYLTVRNTVLMDTLFNDGRKFHGDTQRAGAEFENLYTDLPRPIQLLIDEMSPGSMAMTVAGGALVRALGASASPAAKVMLAVFRPMAEGGSAFARQAAFGVASRSGYEYTDGAPLPVRLAVGFAAGALAGNPNALLDPSTTYARNVWRALVDSPSGVRPAEPALRGMILPPIPAPNVANSLTGGAGAVYGFATGDDMEDSLKRAVVGGALGYAGGSFASRAHRTPIDPPDVIPMNLPTSSNGIRLGRGLNPDERFAMPDAIDHAADLAEQLHQAKLREPGANVFFTETEVPPPIAWALQRAQQALRPGQAIEQAIEYFPVTRNLYALLKPSANIPENVRQAYWAEGAAICESMAQITPSQLHYIDEMKRLFGGTDIARRLRYIGPSTRTLARKTADGVGEVVDVAAKDHPLTGKVYDALTNPENYDLNDAQRGFIAKFDLRNSTVSEHARGYGVEIGDFDATVYEQLGYHFGPRPVGLRDRAFLPIVEASGRPGQHVADPQQAVGAGRLAQRKWNTLQGRMADIAEAGFEPVTDVAQLLDGMDAAKVRAIGRQVFRWGVGGQLVKESGAPRLLERTGTYVTDAVANAVTQLEKDTDSSLRRGLALWRGARLNADTSPLTIQGALSFFSSPVGSAKAMLGAIARGEMADMMNPRMLADDWARNPETWLDFAFHQNIPVKLGTPEEFATGLLERLPLVGGKIQQLNEGLFTLNLRAMKNGWEKDAALLMDRGVSPEAAKAAAADTWNKIIPLMDPRKLGMSALRSKWETAIPTSASFLRQPVAFMSEAAAGYVKLGLQVTPSRGRAWAQLTPNEQLAVTRFTKMQGTVVAMSVTSALLTAKERNLDSVEAMQRATDPDSGDFLRLWLSPTFSIPLGNPYRALIKAVWPRDVTGEDGETHSTPFAGIGDFLEGRAGPALSSIGDLYRNRDFLNQKIVRGDFPENVLSALEYGAEQAVPIAVAEPLEARRLGLPFDEGKRRTASQLAGASGTDVSPYEGTETSRRGGFRQIRDAPERSGMTAIQQQAALGVTDIADLRARIGTRAANVLTEQNAPDFPASYERWVSSVRTRAAAGDRDAKAMLVGVELQARLSDLATEVTKNGQPDKEAYRLQRGAVVDRSVGEGQAYADVFNGFRKSTNEIDQLSAQWYDLMDKSRRPSGNIDFETFNKLEESFFAKMPPDTAELVRSNVESVPRGANPLEVELRQVRHDLEATGFFKIEDQQWEVFRKAAPTELDKFPTFAEYRADVVTKLADAFKKTGMAGDVALQFADRRAASLPVVAGFDKAMQAKHAEWALAHQDLAQPAIAWGYLSPSLVNIAVSGSTSPRTSVPVQSADSAKAVELWEAGKSYGAIGIALGKTDGAVEQLLRRHYGGSPDAARQKVTSTP